MAEIGYQQLDSGLGKDEDVLYSPESFLLTPPNTALALLKTYTLCKLRARLFQLPGDAAAPLPEEFDTQSFGRTCCWAHPDLLPATTQEELEQDPSSMENRNLPSEGNLPTHWVPVPPSQGLKLTKIKGSSSAHP